MTTKRDYQFVIYDENADFIRTRVEPFAETVQAKRHAGKLCKRHGGPVDLAFAEGGDWAARYISTAEPSPVHMSGYRTTRLDS